MGEQVREDSVDLGAKEPDMNYDSSILSMVRELLCDIPLILLTPMNRPRARNSTMRTVGCRRSGW